MKRFHIGVGILAVILGCGILLTLAMGRIHMPISGQLARASQCARAEDWETARRLTEEAKARWETYRGLTAAVADHVPMEQIDSGFEEAEAFLLQQDANEFSAACAALSRLVKAMADSQSVAWWNVL